MIFISIPAPPLLPPRWNTVYKVRSAAFGALATHELRSNYLGKHSSWKQLKKWLSHISRNKCWYCEAKSTRAPLDVDHFRPKLRVTVDGIPLVNYDGYYWLAYEWSNFRLSCQRCNRPEKDDSDTLRGKANEFPIQDEARRWQPASDPLEEEFPRLLDPCNQGDCALLADCTDGEVKPSAPENTWEFDRAKYTIRRLGFNEWNTPESKRSHWQTLSLLLDCFEHEAPAAVVDKLKNYLSPDQEYSSFFRSAIGSYRDRAWVEALL
ncbi:hypothetical protein [Dyella sp.]|uniref:hypothetical protein n=1 Tax=Dyella sp. TaxID=1869338 RepID=UPI002D766DCB|nr:hypothetical protein [Dyella sp.]HET6432556.1 hypothetical protein [Dyella sp.]